MTETAGPCISLMSEFAACVLRIDSAVIFGLQRVGPSTGLPNTHGAGRLAEHRVSLARRYQAHPDHPELVEECYERRRRVRFVRALQTPIFGMMDLDLGMNNWCRTASSIRPSRRPGKLLTPEILKKLGEWGRYKDVDGDGIAYRTIPGDGMPAFSRAARVIPECPIQRASGRYVRNVDRLSRKFETARQFVPAPVVETNTDA